jgi:hypothetical protein
MLRLGGIKVFADGGACNVPAVSYTYEDGSSGDLYFDVDGMESIISEVEEAGYQIAVHALGDRAVATVLEAMERVVGDSGNPFRHRIDHSAVVRPDTYGRHHESGAVAALSGVLRTCALTDANNDYLYRTPDEFLSWEWPWRQLLDSNPETLFAWHADYPALPASLGANLAGFVTRVEGDCQPTPEMAAGTITIDEALHLMTIGSAYALDRDEEVGSLAAGSLGLNAWHQGRMWPRGHWCLPRRRSATVHLSTPSTAMSRPDGELERTRSSGSSSIWARSTSWCASGSSLINSRRDARHIASTAAPTTIPAPSWGSSTRRPNTGSGSSWPEPGTSSSSG